MLKRRVAGVLGSLLLIGCFAQAQDSAVTATSAAPGAPTTLRAAAKGHFLIGTAVQAWQFDNPQQVSLVATQFDCLTPGNEMKPDALQNVKGKFTFENADKIVAFAEANDMKVIGHTLLWHNQSPAWLFADKDGKPLPREEALANLKTHITTVMTHFKGKVYGYDVINEAISDNDSEFLRNTPARRAIGDDYIEKAFEFAHEADPDVELYYNDYNIENPGKRENALKLVHQLKAKGVRLDAVGIQGHWLMKFPDVKVIDDAIGLFAKEGVKVMITEMDIDPLPRKSGAEITETEKTGLDPYKNGLPPEVSDELAKRYADIFKVFMKHDDAITRVTIWGTDDGTSWLNMWPVKGRTNHPLLWDRQFQPKRAFYSVLDVLNGDH